MCEFPIKTRRVTGEKESVDVPRRSSECSRRRNEIFNSEESDNLFRTLNSKGVEAKKKMMNGEGNEKK